MSKYFIVVDMQNDFITGVFGSKQAQQIVGKVAAAIEQKRAEGYKIIFTKDVHTVWQPNTRETRTLPVHCENGTYGSYIHTFLNTQHEDAIIIKDNFGTFTFDQVINEREPEIEMCGLCTDICVISNAIILNTLFPAGKITVFEDLTAGTSRKAEKAAYAIFDSLLINHCNSNIKFNERIED